MVLFLAISLVDDSTELALGLGSGDVILISGDLMHDRFPKFTYVRKSGDCVTGVHFREDGDNTSLWVVTTKQVMSYFIKKRHPRFGAPIVLDDEKGSELRCSAVNDEKQLVVAHASDLKFYEGDDVGPCMGLDGNKRILSYYKNYFVVVSEDNKDVVNGDSTLYCFVYPLTF